MISMQLSEAASTVHATFQGEDAVFSGCSTDSRKTSAGELFIALRGEFHDGHDFVEQARSRGAIAALVERPVSADLPVMIVEDARSAMGKLAEHWRCRFTIPLVAITGSNGKTTVKEMLKSILQQHARVHATTGNLNNDIGVPLTLFGLDNRHIYAIVEMGANHPGEISYLSRMSHPAVALITQCAPAHLEGFGSIKDVASAKAEIFEGLDRNGIAVINADDAYAEFWYARASQVSRICFAMEKNADISAENVRYDYAGGTSIFSLLTPRGSIEVMLPLPGKHNVMNALAAAACAIVLDLSLVEIKQGLECIAPINGRMQWKKGIHQSRIIDDTYNANPQSLLAAINVLKHIPAHKWLVLGDMGELGASAEDYHVTAGRNAHDGGVERLFTTGELSRLATDSFGKGAGHYENIEQLLDAIKSEISPNTTILVKGSRAMHMERVVNALVEAE